MTNYKVLPFTEENLKLEGAEVWHKDHGKAKYVSYLSKRAEWLFHWGSDDVSIHQAYFDFIEIRISVKQYTVAEVWDEVCEHFEVVKFNQLTPRTQNFRINFARRIADLAKADQLKFELE